MERRSGPLLFPYNCFPVYHSDLHPNVQCYTALSFWQRRSIPQTMTFVHLCEIDQQDVHFS